MKRATRNNAGCAGAIRPRQSPPGVAAATARAPARMPTRPTHHAREARDVMLPKGKRHAAARAAMRCRGGMPSAAPLPSHRVMHLVMHGTIHVVMHRAMLAGKPHTNPSERGGTMPRHGATPRRGMARRPIPPLAAATLRSTANRPATPPGLSPPALLRAVARPTPPSAARVRNAATRAQPRTRPSQTGGRPRRSRARLRGLRRPHGPSLKAGMTPERPPGPKADPRAARRRHRSSGLRALAPPRSLVRPGTMTATWTSITTTSPSTPKCPAACACPSA